MKFTIELNAHELNAVVQDGTLLEFTKSVNSKESEAKGIAAVVSEKPTSLETAAPVNVPTPIQPQVQTTVPLQQPVVAPAAIPISASAQIPVEVPVQTVAAVPTQVQTYTKDQLAVAATQLVDAGKRQELVNLLGEFGISALTALPIEQHGAFATRLRALGAKL